MGDPLPRAQYFSLIASSQNAGQVFGYVATQMARKDPRLDKHQLANSIFLSQHRMRNQILLSSLVRADYGFSAGCRKLHGSALPLHKVLSVDLFSIDQGYSEPIGQQGAEFLHQVQS